MYNSRRANDALIERLGKTGKYGSITFGQRRDPCVGIFGKVILFPFSSVTYLS
jgi:torulene dioxygenase